MVGRAKSWIRWIVGGAAIGTLLFLAPLAGTAATVPPTGFSQALIPFTNLNGVRDWRADGGKGMWILAANGGWYYASFSSQCTTLPVVAGISFVPDLSGTLSRWSSIRLDHNDRCFFRSLQASDAPPKKGETDKSAASPGTTEKAALRSNPKQPASLRLDSPDEVALPAPGASSLLCRRTLIPTHVCAPWPISNEFPMLWHQFAGTSSNFFLSANRSECP